jgi:hypothetical protein
VAGVKAATTLELRSRTKELGKSPKILGEATQARTTILLFMLPFTLLVVLASSTCGDQHFLVIVCCEDHHPIRIGDERARPLTAWPVMTKNWRPSWEKELPGERPRETAET